MILRAYIFPSFSVRHTQSHFLQLKNTINFPPGYSPYKYDMSKVPECAYTNKHYYNLTFCLQDDYYPV